MSIYKYLQLQPVEADAEGETSELNKFDPDETFDLAHEEDPDKIMAQLDKELEEFRKEPLNYSDAKK